MKTKLPTAARVIGILGLLGGFWNGILGSIALLVRPGEGSLLAIPKMRLFFLAATILGWYFAIFACAVLLRKEIGREGFIGGFWLAIAFLVTYLVSMIVAAPRIIVIVGAVLGGAFWGTILYLLIRYFMREHVKAAFQAREDQGEREKN